MDYDYEKIDEVTLALMYLTLHDYYRAWKGFDWDTLNRLYEKDWISDPRSKARSVVFTEEGLEKAKALFQQYFGILNNE